MIDKDEIREILRAFEQDLKQARGSGTVDAVRQHRARLEAIEGALAVLLAELAK